MWQLQVRLASPESFVLLRIDSSQFSSIPDGCYRTTPTAKTSFSFMGNKSVIEKNTHKEKKILHLCKIAFPESVLNCVCPLARFAFLFDLAILVIKQSLGSLCMRKGVDSKSTGALYSHPDCWQNHYRLNKLAWNILIHG